MQPSAAASTWSVVLELVASMSVLRGDAKILLHTERRVVAKVAGGFILVVSSSVDIVHVEVILIMIWRYLVDWTP